MQGEHVEDYMDKEVRIMKVLGRDEPPDLTAQHGIGLQRADRINPRSGPAGEHTENIEAEVDREEDVDDALGPGTGSGHVDPVSRSGALGVIAILPAHRR